jgi:hypothetical protein
VGQEDEELLIQGLEQEVEVELAQEDEELLIQEL